ncbi:hypothetical protein yberc0001_25820 [Yersinia bercovieri ATCC 43970]|uniref:Uncharacterized protein n=1 Tax=Yersinia bercovieri ATCC 43970 TaxID=349968 RepID=A0ABM9XYS4_YERBE|nr:hypothetical protein yberc0001_25820 [Yersinia bercovieri ATCC 43970]
MPVMIGWHFETYLMLVATDRSGNTLITGVFEVRYYHDI